VKVAFEELGRRKKEQLAKLEAVAGPNAAHAAVMPGIYPLDAVAKVECYVCGFVADTKAMPNQCPSCGAARYAFEKEIALTKAWEIASETERHATVLIRESAARAAGPARTLLEELAREDEGQATLADRQLAELRTRSGRWVERRGSRRWLPFRRMSTPVRCAGTASPCARPTGISAGIAPRLTSASSTGVSTRL